MDSFNSCGEKMIEDNLEKLYEYLKFYIEGLDGINQVYRNALDLSSSFSSGAVKISLTLMLIRDLIDDLKKNGKLNFIQNLYKIFILPLYEKTNI